MMSNKTHYAILGVNKNSTQDDIKAAFRKLSKETHPDLHDGCDAKAAAFKLINNAHATLSDPTSRRLYDQELQEATMWRAHRGGGMSAGQDPFGGGLRRNMGGRGRHPSSGMHVAMQTLQSPRFLLVGVVGLGSVAFLGAMMGGATSNRPEYHHNARLVEAWKNPDTGRWEQPAPWDPTYSRMKPKLELVERGKVQKRHI